MKFVILIINVLVITKVQSYNNSRNGTNLLSQLTPNWKIRSHTGFGLKAPVCSVMSENYTKSPYITMYGLNRQYSAVLTGYNLKDENRARSNKGYVYGFNAKVRPPMIGKTRFLFLSDISMPRIPEGQSAEFCCHIYSPPLKIGPSLRNLEGTSFDDPKRYFGSDEKVEEMLRKESNGASKRITSCCFVITGHEIDTD